ncbi:MAG: hypothetical protein L0387_38180 [Acidobacteria bacterium]|nr:hypothetical protein [Acidobacteriota bacterium]MCI0627415.1 hypothetical protein [Acidobacteriota bacterium]MCI0723365.1 hypothetical protein [Acidobacteriota bacterium]
MKKQVCVLGMLFTLLVVVSNLEARGFRQYRHRSHQNYGYRSHAYGHPAYWYRTYGAHNHSFVFGFKASPSVRYGRYYAYPRKTYTPYYANPYYAGRYCR